MQDNNFFKRDEDLGEQKPLFEETDTLENSALESAAQSEDSDEMPYMDLTEEFDDIKQEGTDAAVSEQASDHEETQEQVPPYTGYTVQNPNSFYTYSTPSYQQPPVVKPVAVKKKKNGLMIALIVVSCLLIFSVVGSMLGMGYMINRMNNGTGSEGESQSGSNITLGGDGNTQKEEGKQPEVNVVQQSKEDTDRLTTEQVVEKTLTQVVGVVVTSGEGFYGSESQGSGIIFSADGYIITNAHVVEEATSVKIVLPDEKQTTYDAKVIGSDSKTDLAVLKVEATGLDAADIGNSDELKLGETVITVGNPYGLELQSSVTSGIVSALNRSINTSNGKMNLIQTDAAINPGNSGGALVNLYGQVVGVCSSKISDTDAEGLGFAIPINDAVPIIKELISKGYISGRPMIGIQGQDINTQTSMMYGVPTGVYVVYIEEDSSAYKAGMRQYDIITEFNGKTVTCFADLDAAKDECKAGETVSVKFYRYSNEKTYTVNITLSESGGEN